MRNPNLEIAKTIRQKTLELLLEKEPYEIGMRDIAQKCQITAANIYHYYKDKTKLFQAISLDCLEELNEMITKKALEKQNPKEQLLAAITAFRDWCFANPRQARLLMTSIESVENTDVSVIEKYYVCNKTGTQILQKCIDADLAESVNPKLDVGVLVSGVWGCIESVILKKVDMDYWNKGEEFTNRFIAIWIKSIFKENGK